MTVTDLGKQIQNLHPEAYGHIPPHVLGRALKAKHPKIYDHYTEEKQNLDSNTIPETPRTLQTQLTQLRHGIRRVVFVARGSKVHPDPKQFDARKLTLPSGEFYYRPDMIKPQEIIAAVRDHELNEILGSAQSGYGAPSKEDLQQPVEAVMSRDFDGNTVQGALTDPQHMQSAMSAAQEVTPPGGSVTAEPPENEINNRLQYRRPSRGGKWPKTSQGIPHQEIPSVP